jgi:redox-sensitive bicupin YhaK (pirin superfamily)
VSAILEARPLGFPWETADPFLFCAYHDDHYPAGNAEMGPAASLTGRRIGNDFEGKDGWRMYHGDVVPGFPQHPHRGFETVTLVRRGLIDHSDSLGATARFGRGDVQWLTAGRGIVHSEMFPLVDERAENPLELFQIWLNLPAADKMVEPHFAMLWNRDIPRHRAPGVELTVVAGSFGELTPPPPPPHSWAARPKSAVQIWTLKLAPGASFNLPPAEAGTTRTIYFFKGTSLRVAGSQLAPRHLAALRAESAVELLAGDDECELLLLGGRPIAEPVANYGPFVMNTRAELQQAVADYQRTQFGGWPWKSDGPVHSRDKERFAQHADGRIESGAETPTAR